MAAYYNRRPVEIHSQRRHHPRQVSALSTSLLSDCDHGRLMAIVYPFGRINVPFLHVTIPLVITHFDVALYVLGVTSVVSTASRSWLVIKQQIQPDGRLRSSARDLLNSHWVSLLEFLQAGTLDLERIVELQSRAHGFGWFIFWRQPLGFIIYLISAIAETNRVPFDLPEAETELVAGFHTEYSAMKFALFFMAEYINMFTVSMLATTLFLGGWNVPFAEDIFGRGTLLFGLVSAIGFLARSAFFYSSTFGSAVRCRVSV